MRLRFWGLELSLDRAAPPPPPRPAPPPRGEPPNLEVLSSLAEGVLAVDARGKVLLCNPAMAPLVNRPPEEAAGHPLLEILRHRDVHELADRVLREGREDVREVSFPLPSETLWQVRAKPVQAPNGRGAVLTFFDITPLRRLENLRKDFVANVSHELKTPLTALKAALETLLEGALEDPAHAREFLETAQVQVDRLQRLIEDLLALSRLEREAPAPVARPASLAGALAQAAAALSPMAEKGGVRLGISPPAEDAALAITADELAQVLTNLIDNAIKFSRPGGRAEVAARVLEGRAEITVTDTGIGIAPEHLPRIFERFYRADKARSRETGGTGLGLSIVKHILENRGGEVRAASRPGEGSAFTVSIPLAR